MAEKTLAAFPRITIGILTTLVISSPLFALDQAATPDAAEIVRRMDDTMQFDIDIGESFFTQQNMRRVR